MFQLGHEKIAVGQGFGFRTVGVIRRIDQVDVDFFAKGPLTGPLEGEKVPLVILVRSEDDLLRVGDDPHERTPGPEPFSNLTERLEEEIP
jgi:hypothetical protein